MNNIWCGMILVGVIYGVLTGNLQAVTEAALDSSKEAVQLCMTMAGVTAFWVGIMKIGEKAGLVQALSEKFRPVLRFLFPDLPEESPAGQYLSMNMLSNILGLGWAATPAGLKAMESLAELEEERRNGRGESESLKGKGDLQKRGKRPWAGIDTASNEMCTFLILNVSSLQLIPMNMIAYRSQYGSVNPAAIVGPGILATAVSTGVAVVFCKVMDSRKGRGSCGF